MRCLDVRRLGKQRQESKQIIDVLEKLENLADDPPPKYGTWSDKKKWRDQALQKSPKTVGWARHPAVLMWVGYRDSLIDYYNCSLEEFAFRGYQNKILKVIPLEYVPEQPFWTYDPRVHQNHRASLLSKEIERNEKPWYRDQSLFVEALPFTGYIWEPEQND
jgi:hypothetical protein